MEIRVIAMERSMDKKIRKNIMISKIRWKRVVFQAIKAASCLLEVVVVPPHKFIHTATFHFLNNSLLKSSMNNQALQHKHALGNQHTL